MKLKELLGIDDFKNYDKIMAERLGNIGVKEAKTDNEKEWLYNFLADCVLVCVSDRIDFGINDSYTKTLRITVNNWKVVSSIINVAK